MLSGSPASGPASIRPSPAPTPPSSRGFSQCLLLLNALWLPGQLPNHREPPQQAGGPVQPLVHRSDTGDKGPARGPALPSSLPQATSTARPRAHMDTKLSLPPSLPPRAAQPGTPSGRSSSNNTELKLDCFLSFFLICFTLSSFSGTWLLRRGGLWRCCPPCCPCRRGSTRGQAQGTPRAPPAQVTGERGDRRTLPDLCWCLGMTCPNTPAPAGLPPPLLTLRGA